MAPALGSLFSDSSLALYLGLSQEPYSFDLSPLSTYSFVHCLLNTHNMQSPLHVMENMKHLKYGCFSLGAHEMKPIHRARPAAPCDVSIECHSPFSGGK